MILQTALVMKRFILFSLLSISFLFAFAQTVTSISLADANPTNATTVNFTVLFVSSTSGIDVSNFAINAGSVATGTIGTPTVGTGNEWNVPVTSVAGNGILTIDFVSNSESPPTAGYASGLAYTIDNTAPTASAPTSVPETLKSGDVSSSTVESNEAGDIYLVLTSETITDLSSLTTSLGNDNAFIGRSSAVAATPYTVTLAADLNDGVYDIYSVDAVGNVSLGVGGWLTVDNTAPTASAPTSVPETLKSGDVSSSTVESNEAGDIYLVLTSETITDLSSLTTSLGNDNAFIGRSSAVAATPYTVTLAADLNDGVYDIYSVDAVGNVSLGVGGWLTVDNTNPTFTSITPATSSTPTTTEVQYTLSENIISGSITWTNTGGSVDGTIHTQTLTGSELNSGTFSLADITNAPTLVDNAIYTVDFSGTDAAGNVGTNSVTGVTYDFPAPTITSATWRDDDEDGQIDIVQLAFSPNVNVNDPNTGSDGLDCIEIRNNGAIVIQNNVSYNGGGFGNESSFDIDFSGNPIPRTNIENLTITYVQGNSSEIVGKASGLEMANNLNPLTYLDEAAPSVKSASTLDQDNDGEIDGVLVLFSEDIDDSNSTLDATTFTGLADSYVLAGTITNTTSDDDEVVFNLNEKGANDVAYSSGNFFDFIKQKVRDAAGNERANDQSPLPISDGAGPGGHTVSIDQDPIYSGNDEAVSFTFTDAEVGSTYSYSFSSSADGNTATVTGSGTVASADETIGGAIDISALGDGTITLSVVLTDDQTNAGAAVTDTKTKDATPPTAPTALALDAGSDSGVSSADKITNDLTPEFTGTAEPNSTVELFSDVEGGSIGTTTADGGGAWTFTPSSDLTSNVTHSINARATDQAGNLGGMGPAISIVLDTEASVISPANVTITAVTGSPSGAGGVYKVGDKIVANWDNGATGDNVTDLQSVTFNLVQIGGAVAVAPSLSGDVWSYNFTFIEGLASGNSKKITVEATDIAGNTNVPVASNNDITLDVDVPTITALSPPNNPANQVSTNVILTATFDQNVIASFGQIFLTSVQDPGGDIQTFNANDTRYVNISNNIVTINPPLALKGQKDYYVRMSNTAFYDESGNAFSGFSTNFEWQFETDVDNEAPTLNISIKTPTTGTEARTKDNSVIFILRFNESITGIVPGLDISLNSTVPGVASKSFAQVSALVYEYTVSNLEGDGNVSITVRNFSGGISDAAGNGFVGSQDSPEIVIDQTKPTIIVNSSTTNTSTPTLTGTISENLDVLVRINGEDYDAIVSGATAPFSWSATVPGGDALFEGSYLVQSFATDEAGNTGNASGTIKIDNTAPTVSFSTSLSPTNDNPFSITALFNEVVSGLNASGDFIVSTGNAIVGSPVATGNPNEYSLQVTPTSNQTATVIIRMVAGGVTDVAGNAIAQKEFSVTFDDQAPVITYSTLVQGRNVTLTAKQTERGKIYYAILPEGATTTSEALRAGGSVGAIAQGFIDVTIPNTNFIEEFTLSDDRTEYELYLVSEDQVGATTSSYNLSPIPINITLSSGGTVITAPNLIDVCLQGDYFSLTDIIMTETIETDFAKSGVNKTLKLELPANFEFNTAVGSVNDTNGDIEVDGIGLGISYAGNSILTLTYKALTNQFVDVITISGIQIRATGSVATSNQQVLRSGGSGDIYLANDGDGTIFATLTSIAPYNAPAVVTATPSVVTLPYILEAVGGVKGDSHGDAVVVYDKAAFNASTAPMTIGTLAATDVVNVYSDQSLTTKVIAAGLTGTTSYSLSLNDLGVSAANVGITTFWVTVTDINSCQSAATKFSVAIIRYENSGGTNAFSSTNSIGTNLKFTNPVGYSAIFTGNGLTSFNNNETFTSPNERAYSVKFIPSAAGEGVSTILYALSKNGVTANYAIDFFVATADKVITNAKTDYCQSDGSVAFTMVAPSGIDTSTDADGVNPDFKTVRAYDYRTGMRGVEITSALFAAAPSTVPNATTGWNFNTAALDAQLAGSTYVYPVQLVYVIEDEDSSSETELATQIINVYRIPAVTITNLNPYYCNDDGDFSIRSEIISATGTQAITISGYHLYKYDGAAYTIDLGIIANANFSPANPNANAIVYPNEEAFGKYKIVYDAPVQTAANCSGGTEVEIEILEIPALPDLVSTGFGGISDGDDSGYLLEYCEGATVSNLVIDVASLGTAIKVNWYNNADATSPISLTNISGSYGEVLNVAKAFFGNNSKPTGRQTRVFYYTITDDIGIASSSYSGCESPTRSVTIEIYPDPVIPSVNTANLVSATSTNSFNGALDGSTYVFEYCITEGGVVSLEDIIIEASLNDEVFTESYYTIYNSAQASIASFQSVDALSDYTLIDSDFKSTFFNYSAASGTELVFYIGQTNYNNNYPADLGAEFDGCESVLRKFRIKVNAIPAAPIDSNFKGGENSNSRQASNTGNVIHYYLCNGEANDFNQVESPGINGSLYTWYEDDGTGNAPATALTASAFNGRLITLSELTTQGVFTDQVTQDSTFTYWVTQTQSTNNATGFDGCESVPTKVLVTVFPDPSNLTFDDNGLDALAVSICEGEVGSNSFELTGNPNATVRWYQSNASGVIINSTPSFTQTIGADGAILASGLDLNISTVTQATRYFLVSQTLNVSANGSEFAGCETEVADMAFLTVNVYNIPNAPTPATNDRTLFYCANDVVNSVTFVGESNSEYNWYKDDGTGQPDGASIFTTSASSGVSSSSITNEALGLNATTNAAGVYKFLVSQTTSLDAGVTGFVGCESNYANLSITIFEIPSAPIVKAVAAQCDVSVTNTSTKITYRGVATANNTTTVFEFLDENKVSRSTVQTTTPMIDRIFVLEDLETKVKAGFSGDTTIYVTQVTNIIEGENFSGCAGDTTSINITVYPTPQLVVLEQAINEDIQVTQACDGDLISLAVEVNNPNPSINYGHIWKLTQQGKVSVLPSDRFNTAEVTFSAEEFKIESGNISVQVTTYDMSIGSEACPNITSREIQIGTSPVPQFKWTGITKGKSVRFTARNKEQSTNGKIEELQLLVKDKNGNTVNQQVRSISSAMITTDNILDAPFEYQFTEAGTYDVTISMISLSKCLGGVTREVTIVDVIDVTEGQNFILQTFDNSNEGWFLDKVEYALYQGFEDRDVDSDDYPSWELGTSSAFNGLEGAEGLNTGSFWATNLNGAYKKNEKSWVYSPAYKLDGLELPTVSFSHATDMDLRDGVVLQFSVDDGVSWKALGAYNANTAQGSGRYWFNASAINGDPGNLGSAGAFNPDQYGWTKDQGWKVAAHKLDVAGIDTKNDLVRFRFALGATGSDKFNTDNTVLQGFAFDDFRIYGRDKKVIVEQFSSLNNTVSLIANDSLDSKVGSGALKNDAVIINYFSKQGRDTDVLSLRNESDPGARGLYYGVSTTPRSVISGVVQDKIIITSNGVTNDALGWDNDKFNSIALEANQFDIDTVIISGAENEIEVEVTFKSLIEITDPSFELSFRFAIVEDVPASEVGIAGNGIFRNVLRKMLPSSGGFTRVGSVKMGEEITYTVLWSIKDVFNPDKLKVIAFVQVDAIIDASLRKGSILQAIEQAVPAGKVLTTPENITVVKSFNNKFEVFPNPSDNIFELNLGQKATEDLKWVLYDQTGRELAKGQITKGGEKASINTLDLPNGLFMLHVFGDKTKWLPKRVMILH